MPPRCLLVATTNPKKIEELRRLLAGLEIQLKYLPDFPSYKEVEEDGKTFEENAAKKALGYAGQTGLLTLAEDSGLCCEALEGAPGVHSARFAGPGKSDLENNEKLLRIYEKIPDNCRGARFVSVVAVAEPHEVVGVVRGEVEGFIYHQIEGAQGFGYDPLFYYPSFKTTFGNVPPEQKHSVSHRGRALAKARTLLKDYFKSLKTKLC